MINQFQFLVNVIMQLLDSAKLELSATAYAEDVKKGIHSFASAHADILDKNLGHQHIKDLMVSTKVITPEVLINDYSKETFINEIIDTIHQLFSARD